MAVVRWRCWTVATPVLLLLGSAGGAASSATIQQDCNPPRANVIKYEQLSGNLSSCIINNTAPARFCHVCIEQNDAFNTFFTHTLSKDCRDFSAFSALHLSYKGLWTASQCTACDVATMDQMAEMLATLRHCIQTPQNYTGVGSDGGDGNGDGDGDGDGNDGNATICESCDAEYKVLKDFYKTGMPDGCRKTKDIIDAYRRALSMWGEQHCGRGHPTQVSAQATLGTFFGLIAVFYLIAYNFGADKDGDSNGGHGGGTDGIPGMPRSVSHTFSSDPPAHEAPVRYAGLASASVQQNEVTPLVGRPVPRPVGGKTPRNRGSGSQGGAVASGLTKFSYESFSPDPPLRAE